MTLGETDGLGHAVEALEALEQVAPSRLKRILTPVRAVAGATSKLRGPALATLKVMPAVVEVLSNTAVRIGLASTLSVSTLGGALYWNSHRGGTPQAAPGGKEATREAAAGKDSDHPAPPPQVADRRDDPAASPPAPAEDPVVPPPVAVPEVAAHRTTPATDAAAPPVVPAPVAPTEVVSAAPAPGIDPAEPPQLPASLLGATEPAAPTAAEAPPQLPPPAAALASEAPPATAEPPATTTDPAEPPQLPPAMGGLTQVAEPTPAVVTPAATPVDITSPQAPQPSRPVAEVEPAALPVASPAPAEIPNLAATPPPAAAVPPASTPAPVSTESAIASGGFVELPNVGTRGLRGAEPMGEPRSTATRTVTLADVEAARPAMPQRPQAAPVADPIEAVSHLVQTGENFWTISRLYYGSGRFYKALWKANADQFKTPESLVVGATIRVPPPEALDRSAIDRASSIEPGLARTGGEAPQPSGPAAAGKPSKLPATPASGGRLVDLPRPESSRAARDRTELVASDDPADFEGRFHVVSEGTETLRSIARDELGNARRADELRDLNLDVVGDRNHLVPGMRLRLPADASTRTIRR